MVTAVLVRLIGGARQGARFVMVATVIAFLVTYAVVEGVPAFPATGAKQKVFFLGVVGLVLGLWLDVRGRVAAVERIAIVVFPAVGLLWMAQRSLSFGIDIEILLRLVALWAVSVMVLWRLSQTGARGDIMVPGVQVLVASVGVSVVALVGASASLAQLSGGLAAAMGGVLVLAFVALVLFGSRYGFGAVGLFGAGGTLLALSYVLVLFTEDASPWALAILSAIFLTDLVPLKIRFGSGAVQRALQPVALTIIAAIPAAIAIGVAVVTGEGASPY